MSNEESQKPPLPGLVTRHSSPVTGSVDLPDLEHLLAMRLRPWAYSIDYDDLAQECRIAGWRAAARYAGPASARTVMVKAIDWARASFFRSAMARHGRISRRGVTDPVVLPLHDLDWEEDGERAPAVPDFAVPLIAQLYAAWVWAHRADWLSPAEAAVLAAVVLGEETVASYAARTHQPPSTVFYRRQRALGRYRARLGVQAFGRSGVQAFGVDKVKDRPVFVEPERPKA